MNKIIITGTSRGIGNAVAKNLLKQNIIVIGEISDAKEVKNTDKGTFPLLICASKPDTWPPGTIKTITAAIAKTELLKSSDIKRPTSGNKINWMPRP